MPNKNIYPIIHYDVEQNQALYTRRDDSDLIKKVRAAVTECDLDLAEMINPSGLDRDNEEKLASFERHLLEAMIACKNYCDNRSPVSKDGKKRLRAVEDTLEKLKSQYRQLSSMRTVMDAPQERRYASYPTEPLMLQDFLGEIETQETSLRDRDRQKKGTPAALTYADFVDVLSAWDNDYVEFRGGKLQLATNFVGRAKTSKATRENRQMLEQLARLAADQAVKSRRMRGLEASREYRDKQEEYYKKILGLEANVATSGTISTKKLRQFLKTVDNRCSWVGNALRTEGYNNFTDAQIEIAREINNKLELNAEYKDFKTEKEYRIETLRTRISEGQKNHVNIKISERKLEELATGHLTAIADTVYSYVQSAYQSARSFRHRYGTDVANFLSNEDFMSSVYAYAIKIEAASTEAAKEQARTELRKYCADYAFERIGEGALLENIRTHSIPELSQGVAGLRYYVVNHFDSVSAWKGRQEDVARGIVDLEKLCRLMIQQKKMIQELTAKGYSEKLVARLKSCGRQIQSLITDHEAWDRMELVSKHMSGTRFDIGFRKLSKLMRQNKIQYQNLMRQIAIAVDPDPDVVEREKYDLEHASQNEKRTAYNRQPQKWQGELLIKFTWLKNEEREIVNMFCTKVDPSVIIKNDAEMTEKVRQMYDILHKLQQDNASYHTMDINGHMVDIYMSKRGTLMLEIGNQILDTCMGLPAVIAGFESHMCAHVDKYDRQYVLDVLMDRLKLTIDNKNTGNGMLQRVDICNILGSLTGIQASDLGDYPLTDLAVLAKRALESRQPLTADEVRRELISKEEEREKKRQERAKAANKKIAESDMKERTYDREILESVTDMEQQMEKGEFQNKVIFSANFGAKPVSTDAVKWTKDEAEIKELLADLIYPEDSWKSELTYRNNRIDRMRYTLYTHADAVAKIFQNPDLLQNMIDKLQLKELGMDIPVMNLTDQIKKMKKSALKELPETEKVLSTCEYGSLAVIIRGMIGGEKDTQAAAEMLSSILTTEARSELAKQATESKTGLLGWLGRTLAHVGTYSPEMVKEKLNAGRQNAKLNDKLYLLDTFIDEMTKKTASVTQKRISQQLEEWMFSEEENVLESAGDADINDMLRSSMEGNSGQGLFMKNVLKGYFTEASLEDKRRMFASALREVKPSQMQESVKDEKEREKLKEIQMGSFLSGLFKGAGPLMHKTLQGIQTNYLPLSLQIGLEDVRSHLSPIPKEIVAAQLNRMIDHSNGVITRIEVDRSLGAASVGEAFQCRIYGPQIPGTEVVVKQIRPDVKRRMMRDKQFFMKCAQDANEGMARTFEGQMKNYENELDLTIEAKNIVGGSVYNAGTSTVKSEQLAGIISPSANTLVVEKAEGSTVGNYFRKIVRDQDRIMRRYKESKNNRPALSEITNLQKDLVKKQGYLIELSKKWVTEAIYGAGFYHADLHKDNIIVNSDGAVIIDYGNTTTLDNTQKMHITHMVFAAAVQLPEDFATHYLALLDRKVDKVKTAEFEKMVRNLFKKKGDVGSKIALVLIEAQKLGIELPNTVYNFSLGQIRLQNTIDDGNTILKGLNTRLTYLLDEHWKVPDPTDPFDAYRKLDKSDGKPEHYKDALKKVLSLNVNPKQTEDILKFVNRLIDPDNKDSLNAIEKTANVNRAWYNSDTTGLAAIRAIQKENKDFRFTLADTVESSKNYQLLNGFLGRIAEMLVEESRTYHHAAEQVRDNTEIKNFYNVMDQVVQEKVQPTVEILGAGSFAKYTASMFVSDRSNVTTEKEDTTTTAQIDALYQMCMNMSNIYSLLKSAEHDRVENTGASGYNTRQYRVSNAAKNAADCMARIPDIPIQSKKYILNMIGLYNLKKAEKDLNKVKNGAKVKKTYKADWVDQQKNAEGKNQVDILLDHAEDSERLYNLRNAIRLGQIYLEKALDTKMGITAYVKNQKQYDLVLEKMQEEIDEIAEKIGQDEMKRIVRERKKAAVTKNAKQISAAQTAQTTATQTAQSTATQSVQTTAAVSGQDENQEKSEELLNHFVTKMEQIDEQEKATYDFATEQGTFGTFLDGFDWTMDSDSEYYRDYDKYVHDKDGIIQEKYNEINSNDIAVLKQLKEKEDSKPQLKKYLDNRIKGLEKINQLAKNANNQKTEYSPTVVNGGFVLLDAKQTEMQQTGFGCWSVVLSSLLAYRRVKLNQNEIRTFRPDKELGEKTLEDANHDASNSITGYTDMVQQILPQTMLNEVECDNEISEKKASEYLRNLLDLALGQHNSPVAFLRKGHYRTIYGLTDNMVLFHDPLYPDPMEISLEELVKECGYSVKDKNGQVHTQYQFKAQWLQDMDINEYAEPVLSEELANQGIGYVGGELTQANPYSNNTSSFRGFKSGSIGELDIISNLPTRLKPDQHKLEGFRTKKLQEYIDVICNMPEVNHELAKIARSCPDGKDKSKTVDEQMLDWVGQMSVIYRKLSAKEEIEKLQVQEALKEVRHTLIQKEKLKLHKEINEKLRDKNGEITFSDDPKVLSTMRQLLEKATYIQYIESIEPTSNNWINRMKKVPFYGKEEHQILVANGTEERLKNWEQLSKRVMTLLNSPGVLGSVNEKRTSRQIPFVKMLTDIEGGYYPDAEKIQQWLANDVMPYVNDLEAMASQEKKVPDLNELEKKVQNEILNVPEKKAQNEIRTESKQKDDKQLQQETGKVCKQSGKC